MPNRHPEIDKDSGRHKPIIEEGEALFFLPSGVGKPQPRRVFGVYGWKGPLDKPEPSPPEPCPES